MRTLSRKVSTIALGSLLAVMTSAAPILTNPAGAKSPVSPEASLSLDINKVGEDIANAINSAENRDAFVKDVRNKVYYRFDQKYNVMVFNLNQDHWHDLEGGVHYESADYHGIPYGVWVFEGGKFQNKGEGGYINWAFEGDFGRSGDGGKWVDFW